MSEAPKPSHEKILSTENQKTVEKYHKKVELYGEVIEKLGERAKNLKIKVEALKGLLADDFSDDISHEQFADNIQNIAERLYVVGEMINKEIEKNNQKLLDTVTSGVEILEKTMGELSGEDRKKMDWVIHSIKSAMGKIDKETGLMKVVDGAGNEQEEGVPVNDLITNLNTLKDSFGKKIDALNKMVQENSFLDFFRSERRKGAISTKFDFGKSLEYKSDKEAAEAWLNEQVQQFDTITGIVDGLQKNSKKYFEIRPDMQGDKQHWRTTLESKLISMDHRNQGDEDKNYQLGMEEMSNRRELVFLDTLQIEKPEPHTPAKKDEPDKDKDKKDEPDKDKDKKDEPDKDKDKEGGIQPPSRKIFVVDASEIIKRLAETQAQEKINEYQNKWKSEKGGSPPPETVTGFFGKFWKKTKDAGKVFATAVKDIATHPKEFMASLMVSGRENFYFKKFYKDALEQLKKDKNLYAEIEARMLKSSKGKEITTEKMDKNFEVLDSIIEQYIEDVAREEEKGEQVSDPEVSQEVANVLYEYAIGNLRTRADVENYVSTNIGPLLKEKGYKFSNNADENQKADGLLYASNLFQVAEGYKAYIQEQIEKSTQEFGEENRETVERHVKGMLALDVHLGLKERDVCHKRTEKAKTVSEWVINKLEAVPVLGHVLASPTIVGAGVAGAIMIAMKSTQGAARMSLQSAIIAPAVGAMFGGVINAFKRGRNLQYDRGLELQRQALGQEAGGKNAQEIRKHAYSMLSLDEVNERLNNIKSIDTAENISRDMQLFIADIYARLEVERTIGEDQFSAGSLEGKNYATRIVGITEMKKHLKQLLAKFPQLFAPDVLWVESNTVYNKILNEMEGKDESFKKFRKKEMVKYGVKGATFGFVGGAIAQGAVMGAQGKFGESAVGNLGEWMFGDTTGNVPGTSANLVETLLPGTNTKIKMPENALFYFDGQTLSLTDKVTGKVLVEGLEYDGNGFLKPDSVDKLRAHGYNVAENPFITKNIIDIPQNYHQIQIPEIPNATFTLPDEFELVPNGMVNGFDIVDSTGGTVILGNIEFQPDGTLTPASEQLMRDMGWEPSSASHTTTVLVNNPDEVLKKLREMFGMGETPPERRAYHGNSDLRLSGNQVTSPDNPRLRDAVAPGSSSPYPYEVEATQADKEVANQDAREQRTVEVGDKLQGTLYDGKELRGRSYYDAESGALIFDASRAIKDMIKTGAINWDGSYDHKFHHLRALVKSGDMSEIAPKFCYRLYLNDADFKAGRAFSIPLGEDGKIHITDPEMVKFLYDEKTGQPRFTAEIAYQDSERDLARVLATKRRGGEMIGLSVEDTHIEHEWKVPKKGVEEIPGVAYDIIPPDAGNDVSPFPPIVFGPRRAMEKGKWRGQEGPYYGGGSGEGWRDVSENEKFFSQTIKEDPKARLDEQKEIVSYFERMDPEYRSYVETVARDFGPMGKECRVSVCIPAYKEGERIYDSLKTYVDQQKKKDEGALDTKVFEVLIFDNHPENVERDETVREVEKFQRDFPEVQVRYVHRKFEKRMPIGYYRKVVNDAALARMKDVDKQEDHILVSHDADRYGLAPTYFAEVIDEFDKNPVVDAFGGLTDYMKEVYDKIPMLHASRRLRQIFDLMIQTKIDNKVPSLIGLNSGFRASIYAAVGGYNPGCKLGEDLEIGRTIRQAREWDGKGIKFIRKAQVINDPRRGIATMRENRPLISEYDDWVENEDIRDKTWKQILDQGVEWGKFDVAKFEKEVQSIFDFYKRFKSPETLRLLMVKAGRVIGAELAFDSKDRVFVRNTQVLEKGMKEYRERQKETMRLLPKDAPKTVENRRPEST